MAAVQAGGSVNAVVNAMKKMTEDQYQAALKTIPAKGAQAIAQSMPKQ